MEEIKEANLEEALPGPEIIIPGLREDGEEEDDEDAPWPYVVCFHSGRVSILLDDREPEEISEDFVRAGTAWALKAKGASPYFQVGERFVDLRRVEEFGIFADDGEDDDDGEEAQVDGPPGGEAKPIPVNRVAQHTQASKPKGFKPTLAPASFG